MKKHLEMAFFAFFLVFWGCVSSDISKMVFACDPDGPNTCGAGWYCERVDNPEERGYKGICKPGSPKDVVADVREAVDKGEDVMFFEDVGVEEGAFEGEVEAWDMEEVGIVCVPTGQEKCDGMDNDCDGETDEDLVSVDTSECKNAGVCADVRAQIKVVCVNGEWVCDYSLVSGYEGEEELSCDDLDNDCDRETEEDAQGS